MGEEIILFVVGDFFFLVCLLNQPEDMTFLVPFMEGSVGRDRNCERLCFLFQAAVGGREREAASTLLV